MADEKTDANTNPDEPFDGAAIENIPPSDSNDQLRIAHDKREAAFTAASTKAGAKRKAAADKSDDSEARTKAPENRSTKPVQRA